LAVNITANKPAYFVVMCSYKLENVGSHFHLHISVQNDFEMKIKWIEIFLSQIV
jgi:hypothetical protein